jgi:predicted MFS family arabinose efflux permease
LQIADHVGWRGALWLVAGLGFAALAGLLLRFPDIPTASAPSLRQRAAMLADRRVAATVGVTFLTGAAGLGLYTYLAPILHEITGHDWLAPYLWAWGFGGIVGSFSIGFLIDLTGRPRQLMALILTFMALAMLALPLALQFPVLGLLPFIVWGAAGWASPAPQQHALLALHPHNGAAAIALNSSVNYLGSATGAGLGGLAMTAGLPAAQLPFVAGGVALLALLGQLRLLQLRKIECASGKSGAGEPEGRLNAARD